MCLRVGLGWITGVVPRFCWSVRHGCGRWPEHLPPFSAGAAAMGFGAGIVDAPRVWGGDPGALCRAPCELGPDGVVLHACDQTGNSYDLALAAGDRVRLFARTNAAYATMPELPPYFANRRDLPLFCPPDT
jgi:hypothetical protein